MSIAYDPRDFHSDYICPECGGLLYTEVDNGSDTCVNINCRGFPVGMKFADPSKKGSPRLHSDLETLHADLLSDISKCNPVELVSYVYEKRRALITCSLNSLVMPSIPDFLTAGELLMTFNANPPNGHEKGEYFFESIFQKAKKLKEYLDLIDDVESGRYLLVSSPGQLRCLQMKYLRVIRDVQKAYGIASSMGDLSGLFKFEDIQELVTEDVELAPGVDLADYLDNLWPYILTLRYAFSINYRTSKQYNYKADSFDIAALLSCLHSIRSYDTVRFPVSNLQRHFKMQRYRDKSFEDFLNEYVKSVSKVPIMAGVEDSIITDRATLLLFTIYLHGHYVVSGKGQKEGGRARITMKKQQAAEAFEYAIRENISKQGYSGPNEAVRIKEFEYDIMKISEGSKRIILADAKFRDPSPSSISGQLIKQELLEPDEGLLEEAELQLTRLKYFKENAERFRKYLNPQRDWEEYNVRSYVITKHVPLIDMYKDVRVMSASDFLSSEL